jgi:monoamine oxidase
MPNEPNETQYDVIIVGSGVAGLYCATELLRAHPKCRIALLEKYGTLGGRASTFHHTVEGVKVQWEAGAGRISNKHALLMGLLKRYKLTWIPIGASIQFKENGTTPFEPNVFEQGIPAFLDPLVGLPKEDLQRYTIRQLLNRTIGPARTESYLIRFPYRGEVDTMRADMALEAFRREMRGHAGYGICAEGFSALVDAMEADAKKRGCDIQLHKELVGLAQEGSTVKLSVRSGPPKEGVGREESMLTCKHAILAIPVDAARGVVGLDRWRGLTYLQSQPLLRVYGVFPREEGAVWYEQFGGRVITSGPVRYIIPGVAEKGTIQISYTDSQDAEHWMRVLDAKGETGLGKEILGELRSLLTAKIPPPLFVRAHPWKQGVTYWIPGHYSPEEMSREAWTPFRDRMPGVHLCGESYSLRQAWVEGALEHAAGLVAILARKLRR